MTPKAQSSSEEVVPEILRTPIVKCVADEAIEGIEAYASGKRSAILVDRTSETEPEFIRLKGCGNLSEGFPIEPLAWPVMSDEVRGCQFACSAYRELYFQAKVNEMLEANKLVGANIPLGVWAYGRFSEADTGLKNEHPDTIDKYCGIFKTLGDRRL